jgi:hypothetical protein
MMTIRGFMFISLFLACVMIIGFIEDPCITEGLAQGCMK